jgi:nitroreductase
VGMVGETVPIQSGFPKGPVTRVLGSPGMEFQEVVQRRRMVRAFTDQPVPPGVVDRLLANAVRAPSAGFSQGWAFLVLDTPADVAHFWAATFPAGGAGDAGGDAGGEAAGAGRGGFRWQGLFRAPVLIVPLSHKQAYLDRYAEPDKGWADRDEARWPVPYWDIDTGMAALLVLLTAVDEGLGALFFGIFPERMASFRDAFGVPEAYVPIGAISVGWRDPAGDEPSPSLRRGRRPQEEVVHRGRW